MFSIITIGEATFTISILLIAGIAVTYRNVAMYYTVRMQYINYPLELLKLLGLNNMQRKARAHMFMFLG